MGYALAFPAEIPTGRMWRGPGITYDFEGTVTPQVGASGKPELAFHIQFEMYIWNDKALAFWGYEYGSVLKHEFNCHCIFVAQWVSFSLGRIEEKWRRDMLKDPEKALENAKNSFDKARKRADQLSILLFDLLKLDIFMSYHSYWEDINNYWISWNDDPFMTWALRINSDI